MIVRKALVSDLAQAAALYDKVTLYLENNINYPDWTYKIYPSFETAKEGVEAETLILPLIMRRGTGACLFRRGSI